MFDLQATHKAVYIWGAGSSAVEFLESYPETNFDAVIETSPKRSHFRGLPVRSPDSLDLKDAAVIIASEFVADIKKVALAHGARSENLFPAHQLVLADADVSVISYQKCGRTWLRLMIGRVLQTQYGLPEKEILAITQSPMRFSNSRPEMPRIAFYHDDEAHRKEANELEQRKDSYRDRNIIFLCRDPRDVVVSNFYHMTFRARLNTLPLNEFVSKYFPGIIAFYNIWARAGLGHILLVRYEDLRRNTTDELRRVLEFIQPELARGARRIDEAVLYSSLENMARYEAENRFGSAVLSNRGGENAAKVRQGKIGGFKVELDAAMQDWCSEQLVALDARYQYK